MRDSGITTTMSDPARANRARGIARDARMPRDDRELIAAFRAGDEAALREIFDRHRDRLTFLAGLLCDDPQTAEELVRRSMVRCFTRGRRRKKHPFRLEVARALVARVRRFDLLRRALRPLGLRPRLRVRRVLPVWSLPSAAQCGGAGGDRVVARALAAMPHRLRQVTVLCDLAGMSYEEAAIVLGTSPRRVGIRLGRARILFSALCQRLQRAAGQRQRKG